MAERVQRFCDVNVQQKPRRALTQCGQPVPDDEPTTYEWEGQVYQADLCQEHHDELGEALAPFIEISRKTTRPRQIIGGRKVMKGRKGTFTSKDVRKWLADQGREVSPSGRIANEVIEEYKEANGL